MFRNHHRKWNGPSKNRNTRCYRRLSHWTGIGRSKALQSERSLSSDPHIHWSILYPVSIAHHLSRRRTLQGSAFSIEGSDRIDSRGQRRAWNALPGRVPEPDHRLLVSRPNGSNSARRPVDLSGRLVEPTKPLAKIDSAESWIVANRLFLSL